MCGTQKDSSSPASMWWGVIGLALTAALFVSCRTPGSSEIRPVSFQRETLNLDGRLDEPVYRLRPFTAEFKAASRSGVLIPETKAWLWWNERGLWFGFDAVDPRIASASPTQDEHAVDVQDRVELFLWPEHSAAYFCVEIAPGGAVHDYSARIYRRFDDTWRPEAAQFAASRTASGYSVEGFLPASALRQMGVASWTAGTAFRLGLFRAEFTPGDLENPLWLTWIDPRLPKADFHVRGAFARVRLER